MNFFCFLSLLDFLVSSITIIFSSSWSGISFITVIHSFVFFLFSPSSRLCFSSISNQFFQPHTLSFLNPFGVFFVLERHQEFSSFIYTPFSAYSFCLAIVDWFGDLFQIFIRVTAVVHSEMFDRHYIVHTGPGWGLNAVVFWMSPNGFMAWVANSRQCFNCWEHSSAFRECLE
ncbi:hypothetical protein BGX38DRAFT_1167241 [Terfezia claveryi]|nr:hypothetical protein BGX38DRAFT_1167241 [Terfezia claveryi]